MPTVNPPTDHQAWLTQLRQQKAIAIIRSESFERGIQMATAVANAGMTLIEITWNSDRPAQLIDTLRTQYPQCQIGVGTVLSSKELKDAIAAGAQFAFSPHTDPNLISFAVENHCPITAGALSPSEIVTAWNAGAASIKVFPVQSLGGAQYIRNLQGPLGHIPLVPTGGVTFETAQAYLNAGAISVGVAGCLFRPDFIHNQDWQGLTQHIQRFRAQLLRRN